MATKQPVYRARVSENGIIKDARFASLRNIGNSNAMILNSFIEPGQRVEFRAGQGTLEDVTYDSSATVLEILSIGGQPLVKNQLPLITITNPTNNAALTIGQPVTLTATASDPDGTITKVTFKANGAVINEVKTPPYTVPWFPRNPGIYNISAIAVDDRKDFVETVDVRVVVSLPA